MNLSTRKTIKIFPSLREISNFSFASLDQHGKVINKKGNNTKILCPFCLVLWRSGVVTNDLRASKTGCAHAQ